MRIAVLGAGGVGGDYGSRLAASGVDIHLIARGEHLAAIQADGLRIEDPEGVAVRRLAATDDPRSIGPVDVVLFCVKSYDTDAAVTGLASLVGPNTAVVSLQNGIDNEDRIGAVIGPRHVIEAAYAILEPWAQRNEGR